MCALLVLDDPLGPLALHVLRFAGLECDASKLALASVPAPFFDWALRAVQAPAAGAAAARVALQRAKYDVRRTEARFPISQDPQVLASIYGASGPPWSALLPRPGPNRAWPELVAAGHPVSAPAMAQALAQVYREADELRRYNRAIGDAPASYLFTFRARALASNCAHLVPALELDESAPLAGSRAAQEPPRKRLAQARAGVDAGPVSSADPRAVRSHTRIATEAGLRVMMASVQGSWESYASGLRCWGTFMDLFCPSEPHFPARPHHIRMYCPFFRNVKTFEKYLMHVHFAERLLGLSPAVTRDFEKSVMRGLGKGDPRKEGPSLRRDACVRLIMAAVETGRLESARLFAVARAWLLRVPSELLPLQANGRVGQDSVLRWHSYVTVESGPPLRVRITWAKRKHAPAGDSAVRTCTCRPNDDTSSLLCGPCALLGQMRAQRLWPPDSASTAALRAPLFPGHQGAAGRTALVSLAGALGLPTQWHAFRRGMAQDMLERGDALAEILLAGGWRSGAFLRYLSRADLDHRVALEYAIQASDDEA